ncbi:hypothetical protein [Lacticaseibacillus songhuajiangensis]|jgi:hypothetical protein|nr:hypothetical protein [Lacticaseibacillus songhuajiangensis]
MRKYLVVKVATVLIAAGVIISALGFAMSGFDTDNYRQYNSRWYYMN